MKKITGEHTGRWPDIIKFVMIIFICIALLLVSILAGVLLGASELSIDIVLGVIKSRLLGAQDESIPSSAYYIVWNLRLPRALLAIAAGGGLAICGGAMQAITQNILADPYILGVSSGASAAVSIVFFLGGVLSSSRFAISSIAFLGALIAMMLVLAVDRLGNTASSTKLVLAGMAVSTMLNAVSQLFITLSTEHTNRSITLWMMGSVASGRWDNVFLPLFVSVVGLLFFSGNARSYNLISLGDETAVSMGVNTVRLKRATCVVVAFVTGIIVGNCGLIGLVGFIIPHIVRLLFGPDHRRSFLFTYMLGAIFLVWMDMLARYIMAPTELPIGLFTAMCGGPFFIWLLSRQSTSFGGK